MSSDLVERAYRAGVSDAKDAAAWTTDQKDERECRDLLLMLDDGDPEALDYLPDTPNLSGQWAGDLTPSTLAEWLDVDDPTSDDLDAISEAYERGVEETFYGACEDRLRAMVPAETIPLDTSARFQVKDWPGVAVYIADRVGDRVWVVMVGDDAKHVVDASDLEQIDPESYCPECGQIGCPHGR